MACVCSSAIVAEMTDWLRLGGGNSGCCGNAAHTYGFHLPANALPASDYSRAHDPAGPNNPYNWDWACAGDFYHGGNAGLRARHATILARLMRGDPALSMICEFIGQPWAGRPVYYWARWDGTTALQRYTGAGHDLWTHLSWWRSRANQRAYLYSGGGPAPSPAPSPGGYPAYPGHLLEYTGGTISYDPAAQTWQAQMAHRGWSIGVDGLYGPQSKRICTQFQQEKGLGVDGIVGPVTWSASWTAPVT